MSWAAPRGDHKWGVTARRSPPICCAHAALAGDTAGTVCRSGAPAGVRSGVFSELVVLAWRSAAKAVALTAAWQGVKRLRATVAEQAVERLGMDDAWLSHC